MLQTTFKHLLIVSKSRPVLKGKHFGEGLYLNDILCIINVFLRLYLLQIFPRWFYYLIMLIVSCLKVDFLWWDWIGDLPITHDPFPWIIFGRTPTHLIISELSYIKSYNRRGGRKFWEHGLRRWLAPTSLHPWLQYWPVLIVKLFVFFNLEPNYSVL